MTTTPYLPQTMSDVNPCAGPPCDTYPRFRSSEVSLALMERDIGDD